MWRPTRLPADPALQILCRGCWSGRCGDPRGFRPTRPGNSSAVNVGKDAAVTRAAPGRLDLPNLWLRVLARTKL